MIDPCFKNVWRKERRNQSNKVMEQPAGVSKVIEQRKKGRSTTTQNPEEGNDKISKQSGLIHHQLIEQFDAIDKQFEESGQDNVRASVNELKDNEFPEDNNAGNGMEGSPVEDSDPDSDGEISSDTDPEDLNQGEQLDVSMDSQADTVSVVNTVMTDSVVARFIHTICMCRIQ